MCVCALLKWSFIQTFRIRYFEFSSSSWTLKICRLLCFSCCNRKYELQRSDETNVEVLWRLAKCCNELANKLESKDERKTKILEGRQYALDAYNVSGGWQTLTWRWRGIPGLAEAFPGREVGCNHDRPTDELRGDQGADRVRSRDEGLSFGLNWQEKGNN